MIFIHQYSHKYKKTTAFISV